ncbi:hypothetical protein [Amylibacter sp. IMCC11727]|uniref:hypothetical protein n=1 Tax=Amylibacter sp. IMCC11727 TaxID=3039851 RepID=UPI00244DFBE8|nr:hypothetical protein [Amylibacter sp. IMCC11727]WGI22571.1 hypothetical protein QBD29_03885 [Amylibacter sp. IMCC11727]
MTRDDAPELVRLGLTGINKRSTAWVFVVLCGVIAIAACVYVYVTRDWLFGSAGVLVGVGSGAWYYTCIAWMDRHDAWD